MVVVQGGGTTTIFLTNYLFFPPLILLLSTISPLIREGNGEETITTTQPIIFNYKIKERRDSP